MKLHILASCRNPELLPGTLLVFKTLRVGFPTAEVCVHGNGLHPLIEEAVRRAANEAGAELEPIVAIRHDEWVRKIVVGEMEPCVISDTDMIFWERVDHWTFSHPWAGRLQPEYLDPCTNTVHRQRLHTSLLFVRPDEVRDRILRFDGIFPKTPVFPRSVNFFGQQLQPMRKGDRVVNYLMDTGANLYHAIGGEGFTPEQLECFSHLHAGTWSDLIRNIPIRQAHEEIYRNPELARGLWRKQEEFYKAHPPPDLML